jgi:hypothetical protein
MPHRAVAHDKQSRQQGRGGADGLAPGRTKLLGQG